GIKDLDSLVAPQAVDCLIVTAIDKKGIIPAFTPKRPSETFPRRGREYIFAFNLKPKPQFELSSYDPVELVLQKYEIPQEALDRRMEEVAIQYAKYEEDAPHTVHAGDYVEIAIVAKLDGVVQDGLSTEGRTYLVGSKALPEAIDDALQGMNPGDTRDLPVEVGDYDKEGNDITVTYDVTLTVKCIQRQIIPAINEAFIKENLPALTGGMAEFEGMVRQTLQGEVRKEYDAYALQEAATAIGARFEGVIPDDLYESMRDNVLTTLKNTLANNNVKFEDFVNQNGGEQQFNMFLMVQARQMLVEGFALDAVYRHEKLTIDEDDINEACLQLAPNVDPKETRQIMESSGEGFILRETAERLKANKYVLQTAKKTFEKK
ncbi:MAG: trigger factor, partial [Eggerthellaceae bacterium]|nr:trigger factor [Eggerthellaceae bacterium]